MQEIWIAVGQVSFEQAILGYFALVCVGVIAASGASSKFGFLAWWAALSGGLVMFLLALGEEEKELCIAAAFALWAVGCGELLIFALTALKKWVRRLARRREKKFRQMEYSLPEQGNEYLRCRLEKGKSEREEERENTIVELSYIRELLAKLKAAGVSAVDRMTAEELSKQLTMYASKDGLTARERVALGDCFSAVLTMAAKYGV